MDKIGDYQIFTNLIQYISDQISKQQKKLSINNEINKEKIENDQYNEDETKIKIKSEHNFTFNIFLSSKTAEVVNMQNATGEFVVPTNIIYNNEQYKITNICDHAFQNSRITTLTFWEDSQLERIGNYVFEGSTIQTLFIPSKLKKLGKNWCAGAEKLSLINPNQLNPYFKNIKSFFVYEKGSFLEIKLIKEIKFDISINNRNQINKGNKI